MAVRGSLRLPMIRALDQSRRDRGRPVLYGIPWQVPAGASYDEDMDAWVDGSGDIVTKTPSELTYYAIPAIWGEDADQLALMLGGLGTTGGTLALANASYMPQLAGSHYVVLAALDGDQYNIAELRNAPHDGAAVLAVARLQRRA